MNRREDGYYWIRLKSGNEWLPAEKSDTIWYLFGNENQFFDDEIAEVGKKISFKE